MRWDTTNPPKMFTEASTTARKPIVWLKPTCDAPAASKAPTIHAPDDVVADEGRENEDGQAHRQRVDARGLRGGLRGGGEGQLLGAQRKGGGVVGELVGEGRGIGHVFVFR